MKVIFLWLGVFLINEYVAAQVPVSQEPMHRNVFENKSLRLLDVHLLPGDTSLFHKHETPSVFIVINNAKTGSEVIMEDGKSTALSKDAAISFESFAHSPRIHRVWNEDSIEFHVIDVEVLSKGNSGYVKTPKPEAFRLLFDEKWVLGYRVTLKAHDKVMLPAGNAFLIVCLDETSGKVQVNKKSFDKKGAYLFIEKGKQITFTNDDQDTHSFAVIEIK